jgi:hypothetical protein
MAGFGCFEPGETSMTYPYGKRERLKIEWTSFAANGFTPAKRQPVFFGDEKGSSPKRCAEECIKWLVENKFISTIQVVGYAGYRLDVGLGQRMIDQKKTLAMVEESEKNPVVAEA